MTCMDCIHYDVCQEYLLKCAEHGEAERLLNPCRKFKNKSDFVEVKHGHWIPIPYNTTKPYPYECNRCGRVADREYEYCHCGAKMDEVGTWSNKYDVDISNIHRLPLLAKEDWNIRNKIKADAIKEFAERLKKEFKPEINYGVVANCAIKLFRNTIDYLVKEMTEQSVNYGSSKTERE